MEPRAAVDEDGAASGEAGEAGEGELAALVRRWMAAGSRSRERAGRESILRLAPEPSADELDLIEVDEPGWEDAGMPVVAMPRLPQRVVRTDAEHATRAAVLIDARRVSADAATGLLGFLAARGMVSVCRAYADWGRADLGDWVDRLRREGLHSFHQYADDDDQALVAMAIDAVDIARDASVDEVVLAGDLTSALPLVHRLHAAGVRVVAVGAGFTSHEVRAACDEFLDADGLAAPRLERVGRHRA